MCGNSEELIKVELMSKEQVSIQAKKMALQRCRNVQNSKKKEIWQ